MTTLSDTLYPDVRETEFETEDYLLVVGLGMYNDSPLTGLPVYQIYNKTTGIIEAEGASMPDAIAVTLSQQDALNRARAMYEDRDAGVPTLAPSNDPS